MDLLLKLGGWGAAGLLVGIGLASWVRPATGEGVALILVVCCAAALVAGGLAAWLLGSRGDDKAD